MDQMVKATSPLSSVLRHLFSTRLPIWGVDSVHGFPGPPAEDAHSGVGIHDALSSGLWSQSDLSGNCGNVIVYSLVSTAGDSCSLTLPNRNRSGGLNRFQTQ